MTPIKSTKIAIDAFMSTTWVLQQIQAISLPGPVLVIVTVLTAGAAASFFFRYAMPTICRAIQFWIDLQVKALTATMRGLDVIAKAPAKFDEMIAAATKKAAVGLRWSARAVSQWLLSGTSRK